MTYLHVALDLEEHRKKNLTTMSARRRRDANKNGYFSCAYVIVCCPDCVDLFSSSRGVASEITVACGRAEL